MSEDAGKDFPMTDEYAEAYQNSLDKKRYEFVNNLSPEEKKTFGEMEKSVEILVGMGRPFILLAAPTKYDSLYWRYQKFTEHQLPYSKEEWANINLRAIKAFEAHAMHLSSLLGKTVALLDKDGKPCYVCTDKGGKFITDNDV